VADESADSGIDALPFLSRHVRMASGETRAVKWQRGGSEKVEQKHRRIREFVVD